LRTINIRIAPARRCGAGEGKIPGPESVNRRHPARQGTIPAGNLPDREAAMKSGIHPDYHSVVFRDRSADFAFLTKSTITSNHTIEWEDGNTYPVIDVEISSASHPFYTGKSRVVDTAGRVEQFNRRYGNRPKRP
jgi:large subunit ribosomal protein L31